jgi:hypothetical protein
LSCTSINSKWIKDLNIRPETLKLVQEGAENTLKLIDISKDFLHTTLATQQLGESMDKWDFILKAGTEPSPNNEPFSFLILVFIASRTMIKVSYL